MIECLKTIPWSNVASFIFGADCCSARVMPVERKHLLLIIIMDMDFSWMWYGSVALVTRFKSTMRSDARPVLHYEGNRMGNHCR